MTGTTDLPAAAPLFVAPAPAPPLPAALSDWAPDAPLAAAPAAPAAPPEPPAEPLVEPPADSGTPAPERAAASAPAPPGPAPEGPFAVQVGSFRNADNAETLVRRLKDQGYRSYGITRTDDQGLTWHVVRVGRFDTAERARAVADDLKRRHDLAGLVVREP